MAKVAPIQYFGPVELCIPPYTLCGVAASASSEWININRLQNTSFSPLGTHHTYSVLKLFSPLSMFSKPSQKLKSV